MDCARDCASPAASVPATVMPVDAAALAPCLRAKRPRVSLLVTSKLIATGAQLPAGVEFARNGAEPLLRPKSSVRRRYEAFSPCDRWGFACGSGRYVGGPARAGQSES